MARIIISKTKPRRGLDSQRKLVIPDQGEIISTTDTKRVFIGTGTNYGGFVVGSKVHPPLLNFYSLSTVNSEVGDIVNVSNKFYQLTSSNWASVNSWADVSAKVDETTLTYDSSNKLSIKSDSVSASLLKQSTIGDGLTVTSGILQADLNTKSLEISAGQISVKESGVDEREISASALSKGLSGGSGDKITLDVDSSYFFFDGNTLSLSSVPTATLPFSALDPLWFGDGVTYNAIDEEINTVVENVDGVTLELNDGVASMVDLDATAVQELPIISVDEYGRVISTDTAIFDIFECDSSLQPTLNATNSLSSIFNGNPTGILNSVSPSNITRFPVLSSDYTTQLELSSAGFIVFEGNYPTRGGNDTSPITRFAIPIFRF